MESIIEAVTKVRRVMEKNHNQFPNISFQYFPTGACAPMSDIIAKYLISNGYSGVEFVYGYRKKQPHAWIEIDNLIVDITSDQFEDGQGAVFVSRERNFHDRFTGQRRKRVSSDSPLPRRLEKIYPQIIDLIAKNEQLSN